MSLFPLTDPHWGSEYVQFLFHTQESCQIVNCAQLVPWLPMNRQSRCFQVANKVSPNSPSPKTTGLDCGATGAPAIPILQTNSQIRKPVRSQSLQLSSKALYSVAASTSFQVVRGNHFVRRTETENSARVPNQAPSEGSARAPS